MPSIFGTASAFFAGAFAAPAAGVAAFVALPAGAAVPAFVAVELPAAGAAADFPAGAAWTLAVAVDAPLPAVAAFPVFAGVVGCVCADSPAAIPAATVTSAT
jgi:hypothetical protein